MDRGSTSQLLPLHTRPPDTNLPPATPPRTQAESRPSSPASSRGSVALTPPPASPTEDPASPQATPMRAAQPTPSSSTTSYKSWPKIQFIGLSLHPNFTGVEKWSQARIMIEPKPDHMTIRNPLCTTLIECVQAGRPGVPLRPPLPRHQRHE